GGRRCGAGRLPGRLRLHLQPGRRPALRHPDRGHRRARVHPAARRRVDRVRRPDRGAGQADHAAGRHLRHQPGHPLGDRGGRPRPAHLSVLAGQPRALLAPLGAPETKIIVSGDLDEYSIAALAAEPVDAYGAGTAVVSGSGAPTAGLVYKLVEVDGRPVVKRSENKATVGGRKTAVRRHKPTGTAVEEVLTPQGEPPREPG